VKENGPGTRRRPAPGRRDGGQDRGFGLAIGVLGLAFAMYAVWRHRPVAASIAAVVGTSCVLLALTAPSSLAVPRRLAVAVTRPIGWLTTRILLLVMFFAVLVPIGFVRRMAGRDPLRRRTGAESLWTAYPDRFQRTDHFEHPY
jgi:hypothetical protein